MSGHTPGPWFVGSASEFGVHNPNLIQRQDGDSIAQVYGMPMHARIDEVERDPRWAEGLANARLIAAAPDLLAALEASVMDLEFAVALAGNVNELRANAISIRLASVRAAITKATGEPA